MSHQTFPPGALAALLRGLASGSVSVHELEIDPERDFDEQVQEFVAEQEAKHRAECKDCAAEHEAKQKKAQARDEASKPTRPQKPRSPIGYMAFIGDQPMPGSFSKDLKKVQQDVEGFLKHPMIALLSDIGGGEVVKTLHIKPLFTE